MLKDITLGQYFPGNSIAHKLDPRTKILLVTLYIIALFSAKGWMGYAVMAVTLAVCVKVSHVGLRALVPILVPLFISAFRRADELATAMECRCYHGGEGRTKLHVLKYQRRDYVALAGGVVILALVVVLRRLGT